MEKTVDAYEEYIKARREAEETEKIATLRLPVSELEAVWLVISDSLRLYEKPLTVQQERTWKSILRSIGTAVREAE